MPRPRVVLLALASVGEFGPQPMNVALHGLVVQTKERKLLVLGGCLPHLVKCNFLGQLEPPYQVRA